MQREKARAKAASKALPPSWSTATASSEACREAEATAPLPRAVETCPGFRPDMVTLKLL
jgi:hypothetical protein